MNKKFFHLFIVSLLLSYFTVLAERPITVLYVFDQPWKDQAVRFTMATGIPVNYIDVPFAQLRQMMVVAFAAGSSDYDVIHLRDDWVLEFATNGWLTPLDELLPRDFWDQFPRSAVEAMTVDGHIYGIPRYFWLWQFYYNVEMLEARGFEAPPRTWAELVEMAQALTDPAQGLWGYVEPWGPTFAAVPFIIHLRAEGGEYWDFATNRPTFNSEAGVRALQRMVDMYQKFKIVPDVAFQLDGTGPVAELFVAGTVAMCMNTPHTYPMSQNPELSKVAGKVKVSLIPGSVLPSASYCETGAVGIPWFSKNKNAALEYCKFVTSPSEQIIIALELGRIPTVYEAATDPRVLEKYPHFALAFEQMQYPARMDAVPQATKIREIVSAEIIAAIKGLKTPAQALSDAEKQVLKLLGK
ncbi:MAG: sugar ABC transporter substrate-binding protein [Candidatus Methanomethylicaceae archaeon]